MIFWRAQAQSFKHNAPKQYKGGIIITEELVKTITECRSVYLNLLKAAEASYKKMEGKAPAGRLKISNHNGRTQYYYVEEGSEKVTYLSKKDMKAIKKIAQRDYDKRVILCSKRWIHWADMALSRMPKKDMASVCQDVSCRKDLIDPHYISDESFVEHWRAIAYEGKFFYQNTPEILAEDGCRVRSKSEKIIADKLYSMDIPYRYEYPLKLENGLTVYPDFTILNVRERKEYYLEHLGMMDNQNYVQDAVRKINTYIKNGIIPGDKLLLTFESSGTPLDAKALDILIEHFFC